MVHLSKTDVGRFCWLDLAATNVEKAKSFYGNLFGWTSFEQPANGGSFTRLRLWGQDVDSLPIEERPSRTLDSIALDAVCSY